MENRENKEKAEHKSEHKPARRDWYKITTGVLAVAVVVLSVIAIYQGIALSNFGGGGTSIQQILAEITPKGTPDYGTKAGVSYDDVEGGLSTLMGYANLQLNVEEQQRYDRIAGTPGTACSYCCGATSLSQNCGCSHNIALQGLTKWLIKNTDYSDEQILEEIRKWQILFFPEPTLREELQKRNIQPEAVGLPQMRGGC